MWRNGVQRGGWNSHFGYRGEGLAGKGDGDLGHVDEYLKEKCMANTSSSHRKFKNGFQTGTPKGARGPAKA